MFADKVVTFLRLQGNYSSPYFLPNRKCGAALFSFIYASCCSVLFHRREKRSVQFKTASKRWRKPVCALPRLRSATKLLQFLLQHSLQARFTSATSVQFKMVGKRSETAICAPPRHRSVPQGCRGLKQFPNISETDNGLVSSTFQGRPWTHRPSPFSTPLSSLQVIDSFMFLPLWPQV